ncbi:MAG: toll/interleukin-1 receptor domain-containing protein [Clostridia bacterium]|nr:toll/interleukin-1 receptor domain-containing protein [Clostridia bacterium]
MRIQIYICYRRSGESFACALYDRLTRDGYRVFLGMECLRRGDVDPEVRGRIAECDDFLLVLPDDAMKDYGPDDRFRMEISHAVALEKNVIPVMSHRFVVPEVCTQELEMLKKKRSIRLNFAMQNAANLAVDRLENGLLCSRVQRTDHFPHRVIDEAFGAPPFYEERDIAALRAILSVMEVDEDEEVCAPFTKALLVRLGLRRYLSRVRSIDVYHALREERPSLLYGQERGLFAQAKRNFVDEWIDYGGKRVFWRDAMRAMLLLEMLVDSPRFVSRIGKIKARHVREALHDQEREGALYADKGLFAVACAEIDRGGENTEFWENLIRTVDLILRAMKKASFFHRR